VLSGRALDRVCVVTTESAAPSDLSVLVDQDAASLHPFARTVRPHLVSADSARLIDELVQTITIPGDDTTLTGGDPRAGAESPEGLPPDIDDLATGPVEVKLLTMTPRLDGLREELPINRERRAVELVAYLALHRPDPVTSDRLRTRVLGSGDADAAAKTLFNTATAARRAMGCDDRGEPLLPPGSRTGHYRVSDAVTVDVQRASGLAAVGRAAADPELAIACLRAALELIEGEPLANALSGYTWWESEGHGGRIAAEMVDAACTLAALGVQAGLFDLAQWGLDRARLVDPYSESLSRAAMQVAAAAGDADKLRREWRECQRRVDELDPGSAPSPRTERLYGELAQQVLAS
jgi:DNA-binding SARP family transcriptional activator